MKEIGFYRSAEDIRAVARGKAGAREADVVRYLEQGAAIVVSPGWVDDMLDENATMVGPATVLTDGTWSWPSSLAYYLRTYHVVLPEEFVAHLVSRRSTSPEIDDDALDVIAERFERQYGLSNVDGIEQ